jgi:hypothetical protein
MRCDKINANFAFLLLRWKLIDICSNGIITHLTAADPADSADTAVCGVVGNFD